VEEDSVLGLAAAPAHAAASAPAATDAASAPAPAAHQAAPVEATPPKTKGVVDVLFTSFIIQ
jgi:hypothetical protein